ncbi:MAG: diguanylate cyclase [Xanthomonadales bacterium]|nr:diguanylate cyclase [Xanthomonadales bacterium]
MRAGARAPVILLGMVAALGGTAGFGQPHDTDRPELISIAQVLSDADADTVPDRLDQTVRIRGVVTVPPGVLAQQYFQVIAQDATGGVSLFSYDLSMPLEPGDLIEAVGVVGQYRGAVQVQDVQVTRIGEEPLPDFRAVSLEEAASWASFGQRVRAVGMVGEMEVTSFGTMPLVDRKGNEITVYFPQKVMRTFPYGLFQPGSEVAVSGVVSIFDQSWPFDSGFQLVVTEPGQIQLVSEAPPGWHRWIGWVAAVLVLFLILGVGAVVLIHRRQRDRKRELGTLNALSSALSTHGLSKQQLAELACSILTQYGLFDAAVVHGLSDDGLTLLASAGLPEEIRALLDYGMPGEEGFDPLRMTEQIDSQAIADRVAASGLNLVALVPLSTGAQPHGTLTVFSRSSPQQSRTQESTLVAGSKLIALGLEAIHSRQRAELDQEALKQLAITDDLTGLYNRRFLDEYLRIQLAMARRRGHCVAFLAIDLDHFKRVNDNWGHAIGDRVLEQVAERLRKFTRASDLPVRYGGEEFLLVLADTSVAEAEVFAERLRASFDSRSFEDIVPGQAITVTASIGIAVFPAHGEHIDAVLAAADSALYRSKNEGRNRATLAAISDPARDA